ncbi:MAG TPA: hypothetical protein VGB85_08225 [Nannocystis sp.]|jgi:hypothetical protein
MKIDRATGVVDVPELGVVLAPTTLRDAWLASAAGQGSIVGVQNEPWWSFKARDFTVDGRPWKLSVGFHGQTPWRVELMALGAEFGTSWDDWSKTKEEARQVFHDRWLTQVLGHGRSFAWGKVASVFDERGAYSSILIDYAVRDSLFARE